MKNIIILVILSCAFMAQAAGEIPLQQAVKRGIELNLACKNSDLDTRSREEAIKSAQMKKRFNMDFSALYLFKSEQMEIQFPGGPGGLSTPLEVGGKHQFDFKLGLKQPLYTGNILTQAVKAESIHLAVQKNRARLNKIETAAAVKSSYFTYRLLQNKLSSLDALIQGLELHHNKLKLYFQEELVKKSDLLETRAYLGEQFLNREDVRNQLAQEKIKFETLTGYDVEQIQGDYGERDLQYSQALDHFKANHPVLSSLDKQIALLAVREKMAKGRYLPSLGAFAEIHYGKPGIDFFTNEWTLYFQGGISLDLKLFDWGRLGRELKILGYRAGKVKNEKEDFIKQGDKMLKELYQAKKSAELKLQEAGKLVQIAREDSRLKEGMVAEMQIDNVDYLTAMTRKERYESMKNSIETELELIKVNINRLIGLVSFYKPESDF